MKRAAAFIALITLTVFSALAFAVSAESPYKINCTSPDTIKAGDTFEMTFSLTDITEQNGLAGIGFAVTYDPSFLEAVSINSVLPDEWKNGEKFENIAADENGAAGTVILGVSAYNGEMLKKDGYSVTVVFKCLKDGETTVKVDPDAEVFCGVTLVDGKPVEVKGEGCEAVLKAETKAEESAPSDDEGSSFPVWAIVVIGVVVVGAAAFVLIKKKK